MHTLLTAVCRINFKCAVLTAIFSYISFTAQILPINLLIKLKIQLFSSSCEGRDWVLSYVKNVHQSSSKSHCKSQTLYLPMPEKKIFKLTNSVTLIFFKLSFYTFKIIHELQYRQIKSRASITYRRIFIPPSSFICVV